MAVPTPEEKLFAVIQGAKHKPLRRAPSSLSPAALTARLRGAAAALDVPKVNQALLGVPCCSMLVLHCTPQVWPTQLPLELAAPARRLIPVRPTRNLIS